MSFTVFDFGRTSCGSQRKSVVLCVHFIVPCTGNQLPYCRGVLIDCTLTVAGCHVGHSRRQCYFACTLLFPVQEISRLIVGCTYRLYFDCGRISVSWSWSGTQWWTTSCRICPRSVAPTMTKVWVPSWGCSTATCPRPDGRRKGAWNGYWLSGCLVTLFAAFLFSWFLQSFKVLGNIVCPF